MSALSVMTGATVNRHTELGEVGETGLAQGSHLHLEIWSSGSRSSNVDPYRLVHAAPLAGTAATTEWDEMATKDEIRQVIDEALSQRGKPTAYTVIHAYDDNAQYIYSTLTGKRAKIATPAHVDMLIRAKTDGSLMNFAEMDIVRGYILQVNA